MENMSQGKRKQLQGELSQEREGLGWTFQTNHFLKHGNGSQMGAPCQNTQEHNMSEYKLAPRKLKELLESARWRSNHEAESLDKLQSGNFEHDSLYNREDCIKTLHRAIGELRGLRLENILKMEEEQENEIVLTRDHLDFLAFNSPMCQDMSIQEARETIKQELRDTISQFTKAIRKQAIINHIKNKNEKETTQ